jgi:U5 small nuclear ribonucleoprotein component
MDPSLYDEFGNYIGPDLDQEDDDHLPALNSEDDYAIEPHQQHDLEENGMEIPLGDSMNQANESNLLNAAMQVVLHEDKSYYPSANDVYGDQVETLVEEEDAQALTVPIIAPLKVKSFQVLEKHLPVTSFSKE